MQAVLWGQKSFRWLTLDGSLKMGLYAPAHCCEDRCLYVYLRYKKIKNLVKSFHK